MARLLLVGVVCRPLPPAAPVRPLLLVADLVRPLRAKHACEQGSLLVAALVRPLLVAVIRPPLAALSRPLRAELRRPLLPAGILSLLAGVGVVRLLLPPLRRPPLETLRRPLYVDEGEGEGEGVGVGVGDTR